MAIKIVFFNHKGGVSKTTTTYNLGWMLATLDKRVLVVDADPQCNSTAYLLNEDQIDELYNTKSKKTIFSFVDIVTRGKGYLPGRIDVLNSERFSVDLKSWK